MQGLTGRHPPAHEALMHEVRSGRADAGEPVPTQECFALHFRKIIRAE